jgi:FSR family fosmidomycin resistance protein-like MFS transporter
MSIFAVGGSFAFVAGPLLLSLSVAYFGMRGTSVFFIPTFAIAAVLLINTKNLQKSAAQAIENTHKDSKILSGAISQQAYATTKKDDWPAFIKLSIFVFFRSTVLSGMITFIPLYWVAVLMQTQANGGIALAVYSFAATVSTLIGGFLSDRYGYNKIINISSIAFIPILALFTLVPDLRLSAILIFPLGFVIQLCFSTVISTGQSFIPNHIGFASGVTMGMGMTVGGITAPILGKISDLYGLQTTFYVLIALACITAVTGYLIPKQRP